MIYAAAIGVLFVTEYVFAQNMNCTKLTTTCPTAEQWFERASSFNCSGYKRYVCLMASEGELREGCIFHSIILAGRIGCPYTNQCDNRTGQPLLVTPNNYLPCPPDLNGCPPHNHSGYSILEIYQYPRCQGKHISEESSLSPYNTTGIVTAIPLARIPRDENQAPIIFSIILGILLLSFTIFIIFRDKCKGIRQKSRDVPNGKYNANSPGSNGIFYTNDGKSNSQPLEGNSTEQRKFGTYSSFSDSNNSQTDMLEKTSKPINPQYLLQYLNSLSSSETSKIQCPNPGVTNPSEVISRTQFSEGNSVSNKLPDTNMALEKIRRMKRKRMEEENCSIPNTFRKWNALMEARGKSSRKLRTQKDDEATNPPMNVT